MGTYVLIAVKSNEVLSPDEQLMRSLWVSLLLSTINSNPHLALADMGAHPS